MSRFRMQRVNLNKMRIESNAKITEFYSRDFRHFGGDFDFCDTGPILVGLTPFFSAAQLLPIF